MRKGLDYCCCQHQELPRFQELIFEDFSRFILVENIFEEVVLQSVMKDIMMGQSSTLLFILSVSALRGHCRGDQDAALLSSLVMKCTLYGRV